MYSVAIWLVCQIVDVVSPALELPDWTLRLVIVLGLIGLPVIIIMSWLLEITPDGLVIEGATDAVVGSEAVTRPTRIVERVIDCSLILAALAIGAQLAIGAIGTESVAAEGYSQKIAVAPFRTASGEEAVSVAEGIAIELQHKLATQYGVTVIASSDPEQLEGSLLLTGAVSMSDSFVRVAVTMVDFDSGVVTWSKVLELSRATMLSAPAELAQEIVAAMPISTDVAIAAEVVHATR
ncbi:MAG: hypothetical protein ACR2RD_06685 [Woeseiaceae bacterium]